MDGKEQAAGLAQDGRQDGGQETQGRLGLAWQANELLLWFMASAAGADPEALAGLPLDSAELALLRERHGDELQRLSLMHALTSQMGRRELAALLRSRVNGMSMAARTPAELATVARTVRALPDWVWDDASQEKPASAGRSAGAAGLMQALKLGLLSTALTDGLAGDPAQLPQLNREQRRALEAKLRKRR